MKEQEIKVAEISIEGYANCSGKEDYECDHDCIFTYSPSISKVR